MQVKFREMSFKRFKYIASFTSLKQEGVGRNRFSIHKCKILCVVAFIGMTGVFGMSAAGYDAPRKTDFTVIIDPGHGGSDAGAVDNNVKEKDINLGVAKKLAEKIKKEMKDVKVVMTRDNDSFITLQKRAEIANDNKGNLFISIHTNSVDKSNPNRRSIAGSSVYALGLHKDQNNLRVAQRENSVIELEKDFQQKYKGFDPSKDESYIIFEMAQKKNLGQSLKFADMAQKSLVKEAGRGDRGVKQAGFWVLWATSMPAVLVELDFICNPNSAIYMASDKGQQKLADALFKAFEKYAGHQKKVDTTEKDDKANINNEPKYGTPLLSMSKPAEKRLDMNTEASRKSSALAKRRRRSETAKKASAIRNVETASIPLHSENERLAVVEVKEETPVMASADTDKSDSKKKNSKNKKSPKKGQKSNKSENKRTYNNKQVILKSDGSVAVANDSKNSGVKVKTHKSLSGYHSKVERLRTVYKIQILASEDILKQNNPCFCGLTPVKSFKENNIYKYTYGESESKQEMERILKQVREKIPDAFIIKSQK